jgi:putative hemolysin
MTPEVPQIDIDKVLKTRAAKVERFIPQFAINWFKRFIYQDEMNAILRTSAEKDIRNIDLATYGIAQMGAFTKAINAQNVPQTGGAIVASNHPLGGLDGLALISETGKIRPDVKFIVNDILMNVPNFENVFVGVNKHGANVKTVLAAIEQVYASNELVLVFPAGLCSRKQDDGRIEDLEWQKSFIAKSVKYNLPIIPTFIEGKNRERFYNLARWRKKLGIKMNFEMLMLPNEMMGQAGKTISIKFGKPIAPQTFDKRHTPQEWAQILKKFIYELSKNIDADFENFITTK